MRPEHGTAWLLVQSIGRSAPPAPTRHLSVGVCRLRELIPESCWSLLDTESLLEAAASPARREGLRQPPYILSRCGSATQTRFRGRSLGLT